jgi:hypothetical protein
MVAPRSNAASWVRSGRSVAQGSIDAFATAREASPDYTDISKQGLTSRARQKIAAMDAEADARQVENNAETKIKLTELGIKAEASKRAAKKQAAKGQMLGKAGVLLGAALEKPDAPIKPIDPSKQFEAEDAYLKGQQERFAADADKPFTRRDYEPDKYTYAPDGTPTLKITPEANQQSAPMRKAGILPAAGGAGSRESGTAQFNAAVNRSKPVESNLGDVSKLVGGMGFSAAEWGTFKGEVAKIESGGKYNIFGGSGDHYDGRYQLGAAAKTDGARYAGIADPGHSPGAREAFRNNPQMQERLFEGFTKANHTYLMGNPTYANANKKRQLEILGYAHNQGMGGAEKWMTTGNVGYDGFGTAGTKYTNAIANAFRNQT